MTNLEYNKPMTSIIIPCYNEEATLEKCVNRVLSSLRNELELEIIIIDDGSTDKSVEIATYLSKKNKEIILIKHSKNRGKGAAVSTGFKAANGDYVAIQDADLEYDPNDLKKLLVPLIKNEADVVLGSRFLTSGTHRVLYFWHSLGNKFLTLLSNMFTDLNLTDMETCYKVFKKDVIKDLDLKEKRFGIEPEIVAKISQKRLRIFEMGISYYGRTYEEGKKINAKDGFRALYCIFHYNAHKSPLPIQFFFYIIIGGIAALVNLLTFMMLYTLNFGVNLSAPLAFIAAAAVNYFLSILLLFRHQAKWRAFNEIIVYIIVVISVGLIDLFLTKLFLELNFSPEISKLFATAFGLILNFLGRKYIVFPEKSTGHWKPQHVDK